MKPVTRRVNASCECFQRQPFKHARMGTELTKKDEISARVVGREVGSLPTFIRLLYEPKDSIQKAEGYVRIAGIS